MNASEPNFYQPGEILGRLGTDQGPPAGSLISEMFSWIVIVAVVSLLFASNFVEQNKAPEDIHTRKPSDFGEVQEVELQTRLQIGMENQFGDAAPETPPPELEGPLWKRYATVVLIAESEGSSKAIGSLAEIDRAIKDANYVPDEKQVKVRAALEEILNERVESSDMIPPGGFSTESAEVLQSELGWLGNVVLNPRGSAVPDVGRPGIDDRSNQLIFNCGIGVLLGIVVMLASAIAFPIALWMLIRGKFKSHFVDDASSGPVYLETFAIWLISFLMVPLLVMQIPGVPASLAAPVGMILTLGVLFWPVVRGIAPMQVAQDIGLVVRNPVVEILCGFFGYLCTLVLLAFSLLLLIPLLFLVQLGQNHGLDARPAIHPIQDLLSPDKFLLAILLACIIAPILEEIMFRGVLYRYLRDRTFKMNRWSSALVSVLISGLIFALIHPQNLVGLIPLTTLATGMALLRQWRSSLVASMTLHAVNNSVLVVAMLITKL